MENNQKHFYFLDWLRGIAAWLVVWDHLVAIYSRNSGIDLTAVSLIQVAVVSPLGIIQDFGWLGVSTFFLISGFVITHVSQRESLFEFVIKRCFRIFPLYIVAILLSVLLFEHIRQEFSAFSFLTNIFLVNYWMSPQVILLGVAWTLAIEVAFYLLFSVLFKLRKLPILFVSSMLIVVTGFIIVSKNFGDNFFLLAATVAYLPFLITGQILYFGLFVKSIRPMTTVILLSATYGVLLFGLTNIHTPFLEVDNSYLINFFYALFLFMFGLLVNDQLKPNKFSRVIADTSYVVYLIHGTLGVFILNKVVPYWGYLPALCCSLISIFVLSYLLHMKVERRILAVARTIVNSKK